MPHSSEQTSMPPCIDPQIGEPSRGVLDTSVLVDYDQIYV
jgi:hypothetical protein